MLETEERNKAIHDLIREIAGNTPPGDKNGNMLETEDNILEFWKDIDLNSFQVVRRAFFAHLGEPAVTFNNCKFYVNSACLRRFPETTSVHVLINRETRIMAIKPCEDGAKDSFIWCREKNGKRSPKPITCRMFFAKIADMMGWNPDHKYKIMGNLLHSNGETLIVFDLSATETYRRIDREGKKPVNSRIPVFPEEWKNQFGMPYSEHQQSMKIDIFDGYAVYTIKDSSKTEKDTGSTAHDIPESGPDNTGESPDIRRDRI